MMMSMDREHDKNRIDISVEIDPACSIPRVVIRADRQSGTVDELIRAIERCMEEKYPPVTGYDEDTMVLVEQKEIVRVFTENRRLVIQAGTGVYRSRQTLREVEELLNGDHFVRISRFEIINLRRIRGFDLSIAGTIRVSFDDGTETWVARRYVRTIQEKLHRLKKGGKADE